MRRGVLIAAGALALALALAALRLWGSLPNGEEEEARRIERRAGLDLVAACNEAAGGRVRFAAADVRRGPADAGDGVVALASVLEARRDGVVCRWNGVDAPTLVKG